MTRFYRLLLYACLLLMFSLLVGCSTEFEQSAITVLEQYYAALNSRDYEKALDYDMISSYASPNFDIPIDDGGDVKGTCERYVVSGSVDYPTGWGAGPSGEFISLYTMINQEGKWLIFESGASTKDSCQQATQMLEKTNSD
jgi:hypothetical protein